MPNLFRQKGYKFYFVSYDLGERAHVHIKRDNNSVKMWLDTYGFTQIEGFKEHELNQIKRIANEHIREIISAWNRHAAKR